MFKRFICWILRFVALVFGGPGETVPFAGCCDVQVGERGLRQGLMARGRARVTGTRQHGDVERNSNQ